MVEYKILVKDTAGNNLGEFDKFRNLRFGKKLNNYGECSFEIPVSDAKAYSLIGLRLYTIHIYRNGTLFWSGEQAIREGGLTDQGDNWATITAYDWLEQLNSRFTVAEKIYEFTDAGAIAWDLIAVTQADTHGDLGITEGDIETTTPRDRTYYNQNVMEAIISLANMTDGFDFEINNAKVFKISSFIGVDRSNDLILEYGVNVKDARIVEDFSKPATRAIVLGTTPDPADGQIRSERDDSSAETQYGLREFVYSEMEVSDPETFDTRGDAILRKNNAPLMTIGLGIARSPNFTIEDFALGDIIRLKIRNGIYNIDSNFRIYEWHVQYDVDNTEVLNLTLGDFILPAIS